MVLHERAARSSEVYKTTVIADILMEQRGYRRSTAGFISLELKNFIDSIVVGINLVSFQF